MTSFCPATKNKPRVQKYTWGLLLGEIKMKKATYNRYTQFDFLLTKKAQRFIRNEHYVRLHETPKPYREPYASKQTQHEIHINNDISYSLSLR